MRIIHVIPSLAPRGGGPPKAVIEMCRQLLRQGQTVEIYTTDADGPNSLDVPTARPVVTRGVQVTYFSATHNEYYKVSLDLAHALKSNVRRYDLVHIHGIYQFSATTAAYYCRKYNIPYVLRPHGALDPYIYRRHRFLKWPYEVLFERRNLEAASAVHFTTLEEMELARSLGLRFNGAVVPLGLEIDDNTLPDDGIVDSAWPELDGEKVVLFLGRVNFKKGLDILAKAFGKVRRRRRDVHLVIAGPDNDGYEAQVREWLADEDALDAVTFPGMVLGARKAALLKRADLFVLSSYSENFGIAVVEAMAAAVPVVISNRVNIWREIDGARAGLVVNPDAEEVANAMLTALDNPQLAKKMGERGRRLARDGFSWQTAGKQLVCLYEQIVSRRSSILTPGTPATAPSRFKVGSEVAPRF